MQATHANPKLPVKMCSSHFRQIKGALSNTNNSVMNESATLMETICLTHTVLKKGRNISGFINLMAMICGHQAVIT